MLLTLEVNGQLLPLMAPVGAAAYYYTVEDDKLTVVFAMMKNGENGLATLTRVRKQTDVKWLPTAARPNFQSNIEPNTAEYLAYEFEEKEGSWVPVHPSHNDYFEVMTKLSAIPSTAPDDMQKTVEELGIQNKD
jgi:hypothetical protein